MSVRRILVAEDIPLVACEMEHTLREMGYEVVGPFARLDRVVAAAANESFDLALFDVNLRGQLVFPAVEECRRRGIPVVLTTGYDDERSRKEFGHLPYIQKPVAPEEVKRVIESILGSPPNS